MDEGTEITIDTLFNNEVDAAKADEAIQSLLPPKGNYQTNPDEFPLSAFANEFEEKDGSGTKRRMITLVGQTFANIEGTEYKTRLRLRLSPDARKAQEYVDDQPTGELSDKDDAATKRWNEALKLYKEKRKELPKRESDVVEFLQTTPFRVYGYHTNGGEMGFSQITATKRGR